MAETERVVAPGYEDLMRILDLALLQAAEGKGKDRHAHDEDWINQRMNRINLQARGGFSAGQALKKTEEALDMSARGEIKEAIFEMLGAINYLASAVLYLEGLPISPKIKIQDEDLLLDNLEGPKELSGFQCGGGIRIADD